MYRRLFVSFSVSLIILCFITSCKKDSPSQKDLDNKDFKSEKTSNKRKDLVIRDDKADHSEETEADEQNIDTLCCVNEETINSQQQMQQDLRVYDVAEIMPEFPGGVNALKSYLADKLETASANAHLSKTVRAMVSVIVETNGTLSSAEIIRSTGFSSLDDEAIKVVLAMPSWKPALNDGEPVRVKYTVPVQFVPEQNTK